MPSSWHGNAGRLPCGVPLACACDKYRMCPLPPCILRLTPPQIDSDLLKRKHLMRYTAEELATLLQDMGFDKLDLRTFKLHGVAGGATRECEETAAGGGAGAGAGAAGLGFWLRRPCL